MAAIFTSVTPDNKEAEIGKVKVALTEDIPANELAIVKKWQPSFQPKSEMYRLELIDQEINTLTSQIADLQARLAEKQALRAKVEEAALKVKLAVVLG